MKIFRKRIAIGYAILCFSVTIAQGSQTDPISKLRTIFNFSGHDSQLIDSLFQYINIEVDSDERTWIKSGSIFASISPEGTIGGIMVDNLLESFPDRRIDLSGARQRANQIKQFMQRTPFQTSPIQVWDQGNQIGTMFRYKLASNVDLEVNYCKVYFDKRTGIPVLLQTKLGSTKWPIVDMQLADVRFSQGALQDRALNYYYQHSPLPSFRFVKGTYKYGIPKFGLEIPLSPMMQAIGNSGKGVSYYLLLLESIQSMELGTIELFVCCRTGQVIGCRRSMNWSPLGIPSERAFEFANGSKFRTLTAPLNLPFGRISLTKVKAEVSKNQVVVLTDELGRLFEFDWDAKSKVLSDKRTLKQWKPDANLLMMIEQLRKKK